MSLHLRASDNPQIYTNIQQVCQLAKLELVKRYLHKSQKQTIFAPSANKNKPFGR